MKTLLARFRRNEAGVTAIEYGLIAALVGVAIIVGAGLLGTQLNTTFSDIATTMQGVSPAGGGDGGGDGAGAGDGGAGAGGG